ncbi:hypothetical protein M422DRAFT_249837 [Sphaerobolus stellatus SS14]|uniref:Uncharacterized protein n=1 Tax=Sphaerobolus stellatus (strain SS14) TaxID=990650 RepID=A0A0C9VHF8_SPHS4|nr:hypothetical protein M422DRAFT_249837 [Sphaerobolus stellatus SS14]
MSAATSSSKSTTTANAILYKKLKDVPRLPLVEKSDPRRTLAGFKAVPEFTKRWDLTKNNEWEGYEQAERSLRVIGSGMTRSMMIWKAITWLWLEKEAKAESKQKSKEGKKKKSKPAAPIASGSGKGKGKGKAEEVVDSEFEADTEFQETCVGCEQAKVKCVFTHAMNGKLMKADELDLRLRTLEHQLQDELSVFEELQDGVQQGRPDVQSQDEATRGEFEEDVESGVKRVREEDQMESGPSKRARFEEDLGCREKEMERVVGMEVGPDLEPMEIDKGKGKEKETGPKETEEDTMKE